MDTPLSRTQLQTKTPKRGLSDRSVANLFLLPTVLLLIAMNVFPLFWSLILSFCDYTDTASKKALWIGGANYTSLLTNRDIWNNFIVTARFTLFAVGAQLLVGFGMALLLNRTFKAKGILTTLILLPMMLSPVIVGKFWYYLLDANFGVVNWLLQLLHLQNPANPLVWTTNPDNAIWSLVLVDTWMWSPFVMLISLAGLNAVPPHLYEAAEVDRASTWFKFRYITIPMVAPIVMIALLFRTIDCFKIFDLVYALTGGGPGDMTKTVSFSLYQKAFDQHYTGISCALAYIILLIIIGLANLFIKYMAKVRGENIPDASGFGAFLGDRVRDKGFPGLARYVEQPTYFLGALIVLLLLPQAGLIAQWMGGHILPIVGAVVAVVLIWNTTRLPQGVRTGLAYCAIGVATVAYLLPIYMIFVTSLKPPTQIFTAPPKLIPSHAYVRGEQPSNDTSFGYTLRNYDALIYKHQNYDMTKPIIGYKDFPEQIGNSLFIGIVSTLLAVSLGTMSAYAFARFQIKGKGDLLFFVLSTRMLPAIAVVIPIFLMFKTIGLFNTRLGLIILYTVFNLSFSTYLLKGFFDDIPHEYDDAALLDGYSRLRTFWKISLPQALTGIAVTAVFCFITAWNEFAFAQVLSGVPSKTAPPSIIGLTGPGGLDYGQIAAGAMLFLLPVTLFTFLMRKHLLRGVTFGAIKK